MSNSVRKIGALVLCALGFATGVAACAQGYPGVGEPDGQPVADDDEDIGEAEQALTGDCTIQVKCSDGSTKSCTGTSYQCCASSGAVKCNGVTYSCPSGSSSSSSSSGYGQCNDPLCSGKGKPCGITGGSWNSTTSSCQCC